MYVVNTFRKNIIVYFLYALNWVQYMNTAEYLLCYFYL